jgi:hypothetical protein
MAGSGSTGAGRAWPPAAVTIPNPLAGLFALSPSPPIDLALDTLSPLARLASGLDELAVGLLRPARRRR